MEYFRKFSGKIFRMERTVLSAQEVVEYEEFKRSRREAEIAVTLKRLIVDCSRRESDKAQIRRACESAKKLGASAVLVSPVNVSLARRLLEGSRVEIVCLTGGTGESLPVIKKTEAKKACAQGAREVRLVPCYSALVGGNLSYLKKEIKKVRRAAKRGTVTLSLEDHALGEEEVALGVRAAREAGAQGVCVRGETSLVLRAIEAGADKLRIDVSGVENSEQLKSVVRAGALRVTSGNGERIAGELYERAQRESYVTPAAKPAPVPEPKA